MPRVQIKRGTRAALDALATAGGLQAGEEYLITDEARVAVGLTANTYQAMAKQGEGGAGGASVFAHEVNFTQARSAKFFEVAQAGAVVGQKLIACVSLDMPAGVNEDELECDPLSASAKVISPNLVRILVTSNNGAPIKGARTINITGA